MLSFSALVTRGHKIKISNMAAECQNNMEYKSSGLETVCHVVHWIYLSTSPNRGQVIASSASAPQGIGIKVKPHTIWM